MIIFVLSILITKIASQALIHTGLSKEVAQFQARSAFTGVGFTTTEAEKIVKHPVRRRIVMALMLIGNVGIISAMASLILTFINSNLETVDNVFRLGIILSALLLIYLLTKSKWLEKELARVIDWALNRFTRLNIKDYMELLNLTGDYEITVINVRDESWMAGKKLKELEIKKEGVSIVGIRRSDNSYIGTPHGDTKIVANDQLILYGREKTLKNLEKRRQDSQGQEDHEQAAHEQAEEKSRQDAMDKESY